eukprot:356726-Rhodomonas_salina.2
MPPPRRRFGPARSTSSDAARAGTWLASASCARSGGTSRRRGTQASIPRCVSSCLEGVGVGLEQATDLVKDLDEYEEQKSIAKKEYEILNEKYPQSFGTHGAILWVVAVGPASPLVRALLRHGPQRLSAVRDVPEKRQSRPLSPLSRPDHCMHVASVARVPSFGPFLSAAILEGDDELEEEEEEEGSREFGGKEMLAEKEGGGSTYSSEVGDALSCASVWSCDAMRGRAVGCCAITCCYALLCHARC